MSLLEKFETSLKIVSDFKPPMQSVVGVGGIASGFQCSIAGAAEKAFPTLVQEAKTSLQNGTNTRFFQESFILL